MAYFLSGVGVEVSPQAVRPREPARPSVATVTKSPEMAARALRPREAPAVVPAKAPPAVVKAAVIEAHLQQVAAHKGQQMQLEQLLKQLGIELANCKAAGGRAGLMNDRNGVAAAQAQCLVIQKAIDACITAIKACASSANASAGSAIAAGASRTSTQVAAASGTRGAPTVAVAPSSVVKTAIKEAVKVIPIAAVVAAAPKVTSAVAATGTALTPIRALPTYVAATPAQVASEPTSMTAAVESSTAQILPSGEIIPGPDAQLVVTPSVSPTVADPDAVLTTQDVTVSSGSLGTLALVGAAAFIGYLMLKKRGKV